MSKRATTSSQASSPPSKASKAGNVWDMIPDSETEVREFKPVEGGPKTKILKTVILNYKPRIVVDVALYGPNPQLRFTDEHHTFTMTGDDYVQMTGSHFGERGFQRVRLEPQEGSEDGFRLAKYNRTSSGMSEFQPIEVFTLNKYAARRLKAKHNTICEHVVALMASEEVILAMVKCVVDVYRLEYVRLNTLRPISEHFDELSRIVEMYVPAVIIVKNFLDRLHEEKLVSQFNHYNLLAAVLSQRFYICDELQTL